MLETVVDVLFSNKCTCLPLDEREIGTLQVCLVANKTQCETFSSPFNIQFEFTALHVRDPYMTLRILRSSDIVEKKSQNAVHE